MKIARFSEECFWGPDTVSRHSNLSVSAVNFISWRNRLMGKGPEFLPKPTFTQKQISWPR